MLRPGARRPRSRLRKPEETVTRPGRPGPIRPALALGQVLRYPFPVATQVAHLDVQDSAERSRRLALITLTALSAMFLVSLVYNAPAGDYFTICAFKNLTGLPCPGCGLAHSFCALAKGRLTEAFGYNALGPITFILLVVLWFRSGLILYHKENLATAIDRLMGRMRIGWTLVIAFTMFGVGRIVYLLIVNPGIWRESFVARAIKQAALLHH